MGCKHRAQEPCVVGVVDEIEILKYVTIGNICQFHTFYNSSDLFAALDGFILCCS